MMSRRPEDDSINDRHGTAGEYVLGLLEAHEAEAFRQRISTDDSLREALNAAAGDLSLVAESLPPVSPPPRVKARFLETIRSEPKNRPARPSLGAKRAHEGKWRTGDALGITYKVLYFDKVAGLVTTLVRMEPGAAYPPHRHSKLEQCLVLEGDLIHDDHVYGPGDFTWAEAGTIDPGLRTKNGNLLLIIGAPDTEKVTI